MRLQLKCIDGVLGLTQGLGDGAGRGSGWDKRLTHLTRKTREEICYSKCFKKQEGPSEHPLICLAATDEVVVTQMESLELRVARMDTCVRNVHS
jgi:hypothetical protein